MKTKEFTKKVEELGFEALERQYLIEISSEVYGIVATVGLDKVLSVYTTWVGWDLLPKIQKVKLFDLLLQYARTPVEKREEEKKYYLRHRWLGRCDEDVYLSFAPFPKLFFLHSTHEDVEGVRTNFSLEAIEHIKEDYDTDLGDYEMVEVEE